ncbi:hypothetical protein WICANDRAFT_76895 [Wickerhamomyces anomalus NRRL Y-366-8]|uniref:Uncharacterized protein n=1 Tax=Wickerhamomyces anomalus (strain ATCC 58044 / CBS 1984 / NCYC 433 / NRRL Y-366-8) TaxID=683960 RepID=A0A1E3PCW5_WICAA|nr:uncharacterized protein WICANDRAFT_76895 [Wickerhamomyces anomalus NRRL Y-366-8]ODQ62727.1 hypothetical protein WICANDRAFT_76895 [Wickerhamomyces anomalus NRRL Y-366-8]
MQSEEQFATSLQENSSIQSSLTQKKPVSLVDKDKLDPSLRAFYKKYGDVDVEFIDPPVQSPWFSKPYALNYFHKGKLFRTRGLQRSAGKLELFLDLVYVGIASTLASTALKEPTGASFLKFVLLYMPAITIWSDLKDFMNYYYNDDLIQKIYVCWTELLLIVYDNNCEFADTSTKALRTAVVAYFLSRFTLAIMLLFYSFYIKQHRIQMRLYCLSLAITSSCWFFIFLINDTKGKCIFAGLMYILEHSQFLLNVNPWFIKKLGLEYTSALNIEHEDARYQGFYIIAIGQFLTTTVMKNPLSTGWNPKLHKGFSLLFDAFVFLGLYSNKDGCITAVHALRRNATTGALYIYTHIVLIASMLLSGNAGITLASEITTDYLDPSKRGVLIYFHAGILAALGSLTLLSLLDKDLDEPGHHKVNRIIRISGRIPTGLIMLGITWADQLLTIKSIMWLDCLFLMLLFIYEFLVMNSFEFHNIRASKSQEV